MVKNNIIFCHDDSYNIIVYIIMDFTTRGYST